MIRRLRRQAQPTKPIDPAIDARFGELMDLTASIAGRLEGNKLAGDDYEKFYNDMAQASLGWTWLSENGYFLEISEPYASAISSIIAGFDSHQDVLVRDGLATIIRVADDITKRNH